MDDSHGTIGAPPPRHHYHAVFSDHAAKRHPITGPMLHNATRSPLARLPEDILLRIMEHADDVSILCLRRTCRTMLWLLSSGGSNSNSKQFDRFFDGAFGHDLPRGREYISRPEKVPESAKGTLRILLQRDMYCGSCRPGGSSGYDLKTVVGNNLRSESLYCSGCKREHPAGLFSHEHRHRRSDEDRICIGREGYIRVCQHHTISWADVEAFMASPATKRVHSLFCNDRSHKSIFAALPCSDEHDHRVWVGLEKDSQPNLFPRCCFKPRPEGRDKQAIQRCKGSQAWIHITWSTHILFSGQGENSLLDYDEVLAKVNWARNTGGGSYIFQDPPTTGSSKFHMEMQEFDPNRFRYLDLPPPPLSPTGGIIDPSSWKWPRRRTTHTHGHDHDQTKENNNTTKEPKVHQVSLSSRVQDWRDDRDQYSAERLIIKECRNKIPRGSSRDRCLVFSYRKSIPLNGPFKHLPSCTNNNSAGGLGNSSQERKRLHKKKNKTGMSKRQTQPWSSVWYMALDPDSINLRDDIESRGVYWCDTKSCLNYYENHRHNPNRRALDVDNMGTAPEDLSRTAGKDKTSLGLRARLRALVGMKSQKY